MNPSVDIIFEHFPNLTDKQKEQFDKLADLYKFWNERINVVSRKDIDSLYLKHVLHSLALAKIISLKPGANIMDLGTGGGFPAIPLAIFFPDTNFYAIDSIGKKITVVKEVAASVGLTNIKAQQIRAENVKTKYDFVVSRAVTETQKLIGFIQNNISKTHQHSMANGLIAYKGGNIEGELGSYKKLSSVFDISNFFKDEFFETKKLLYVSL